MRAPLASDNVPRDNKDRYIAIGFAALFKRTKMALKHNIPVPRNMLYWS